MNKKHSSLDLGPFWEPMHRPLHLRSSIAPELLALLNNISGVWFTELLSDTIKMCKDGAPFGLLSKLRRGINRTPAIFWMKAWCSSGKGKHNIIHPYYFFPLGTWQATQKELAGHRLPTPAVRHSLFWWLLCPAVTSAGHLLYCNCHILLMITRIGKGCLFSLLSGWLDDYFECLDTLV